LRMRRITIGRGVFGLRYWRVDLAAAALPFDLLDVLVLGKAAVGQRFLGVNAEALVDFLERRLELSHVAARGGHRHRHDNLAGAVGGVLDVECRAEAAIGHLHHRGLWIGAAGPRLVLLVGLLLRFHLREALQRLAQAYAAFPAGAFAGLGLAAAEGARILVQFLLEPTYLFLGFLKMFLQRGLASEGSRPGAGADAHAIVGHAVEIDQFLLAQHGHRVRQQLVEESDVRDSEIGQGMVVDGDTADQPAKSVMVSAQPSQGAGGADAFEGGVQPQGDAQAWVDGRATGPAFPGTDRLVKRGQVQAQAEVPGEPRLVLLLQEVFQGHGREELLAVGSAQPRWWSSGRFRGQRSSLVQALFGSGMMLAPLLYACPGLIHTL